MVYKDKDKQRKANRKASQRRRDMLKGMANQGVMDAGMTKSSSVIPEDTPIVIPCESHIDASDISAVKALHQVISLKRGNDIKCFEDLPPDVQETIRAMSDSNEEFQKRTVAAIKYQHLFPDRYHSTGIAI